MIGRPRNRGLDKLEATLSGPSPRRWIYPAGCRKAASLRRRNSSEDLGAHLPDMLERLSEGVRIAVVQLHVVAGCGIRFEPNGMTDHKCDSLSLRLPYTLRSLGSTRGKMQPRMRDFMRQHVEFLGGRHVWQQNDFSGRALPLRGKNALRIFQNAFGL